MSLKISVASLLNNPHSPRFQSWREFPPVAAQNASFISQLGTLRLCSVPTLKSGGRGVRRPYHAHLWRHLFRRHRNKKYTRVAKTWACLVSGIRCPGALARCSGTVVGCSGVRVPGFDVRVPGCPGSALECISRVVCTVGCLARHVEFDS